MSSTLIGIFFVLHGLVHLWYVVLSFNWVKFLHEMGWTGKSWLLTPIFNDTRLSIFAGALFIIVTVAFVASGVCIIANAAISQQLLLGSAIFSSLILILFWDGNLEMIVQKGLIGLSINVLTIIIILFK